jgi:hypothetical protein
MLFPDHALIQPALGGARVIRPRVGRRELLRGRTARSRIGRRRHGDRRRTGRAWRRGLPRSAGCCAARGRVLPLLMRNELLIAGSAGPRRHVLGHTAGPRRHTVGYKTRDRTAAAQRQANAKHSRRRQPAPGQDCSQIPSPIRSHRWRSPRAKFTKRAPTRPQPPVRNQPRRAFQYRSTRCRPTPTGHASPDTE